MAYHVGPYRWYGAIASHARNIVDAKYDPKLLAKSRISLSESACEAVSCMLANNRCRPEGVPFETHFTFFLRIATRFSQATQHESMTILRESNLVFSDLYGCDALLGLRRMLYRLSLSPSLHSLTPYTYENEKKRY